MTNNQLEKEIHLMLPVAQLIYYFFTVYYLLSFE